LVDRAGVAISPVAAWLLMRVERDQGVDPVELGVTHDVPVDRIEAGLDELETRKLVEGRPDRRRRRELALTKSGCEILERLLLAA
ncbi:MAG TPA: hypothetical protein VIP11_12485, partial [Gemmatimonadaceae bacterium]